MNSEHKTISIIVKGKVQGVFYRQSTKEKAKELSISAQVMNTEEGDVYIIATGIHEQLQKLIEWCRHGPPAAKVMDVITEEMNLREFDSFSLKRF